MKILRFVIDKLSDIIYYAIYESRASIKLPPIKNRILLLPATTIATKIRSRDLTSFEVCEAFIARINSVNDVTNAVVDNRFDDALGAKYLVFVSSRSLKTRELSFAQLNNKIYNYVKQNIIVNFIIQKLKNKHTFLKKYTN